MFAQHVTSLNGAMKATPTGEDRASSAFYAREAPGAPRDPKVNLMTPNQEDGLNFYFPSNTGYDGATNEQAEVTHPGASMWMNTRQAQLIQGRRVMHGRRRRHGGGAPST